MAFCETATFNEVVAATEFSISFGVVNHEGDGIVNAEVNILQSAGNQEFCAFGFAFTERTEIFVTVNTDDIDTLSSGFTDSSGAERATSAENYCRAFTDDLLSQGNTLSFVNEAVSIN